MFESMAAGFQRAIARSSVVQRGDMDDMEGSNSHAGKQSKLTFTEVINQEYIHQAAMQTDDLAPMI